MTTTESHSTLLYGTAQPEDVQAGVDDTGEHWMNIQKDLARWLSPLPRSHTVRLVTTCYYWDKTSPAPAPTLHYGFLLSFEEREVLAQKLLEDERVVIEDAQHQPPIAVVHKYLNDTLKAIYEQEPVQPGENTRIERPEFRTAVPVSPEIGDMVFALYWTAPGRGWWPRMMGTAVRVFQELVPGREPMWYFDAFTYAPWLRRESVGFYPETLDPEEVVGSALIPFLHGGGGQ
ncbi:hypothetical protein TRAPUB_9341 [Trametes pubescens]|uniref:Uncharacterized protein n=1 Tax=Trametes pubescens TaxID=154538 RepID=A0A1M2W2S5_TRAPU|nr:hypothetical protein TRAPUB_9341 [Trametes pubescens]